MTTATHPADRMEAIYAAMNETEDTIKYFEAKGWDTKRQYRRLAGLKSARTRILRSL